MTEVASPEHRADRHVKDLELKWHNSKIDRCSRDPKFPTCTHTFLRKSFMMNSTKESMVNKIEQIDMPEDQRLA